MGNLPFYESFKEFGMTHAKQIKEACSKGEWKWLVGYIFFCLFLLVPTTGYFVAGLDYLISTTQKYTPVLFESDMPPKTLTYRLIEREKTEDDLYRTLFEIFVHNPPGNTDPKTAMTIQMEGGGECEKGSETAIAEIMPGVSSTTDRFLMDCLTKEPVLDTGDIFRIVN